MNYIIVNKQIFIFSTSKIMQKFGYHSVHLFCESLCSSSEDNALSSFMKTML